MEIRLATILKNLKDYLLSSTDECVLFDFLVLKQHDFGLGKPFRHSIPQVETATLIKRKTQNRILSKFSDIGFLKVGKELYQNSEYRSFFVDFSELSKPEVLGQIIRMGTETYENQLEYYQQWAKEQKAEIKPPTKKQQKALDEEAKAIDKLLASLVSVWNERVDMYNKGELTSGKIERRKVHASAFRADKRLLKKLRDKYSDEGVRKCFMVYADKVLKGEYKPEDTLSYFLAYEEGEFSVASKCHDYYIRMYGINL